MSKNFELSSVDFEILEFIYRNEPVHIEKVQSAFPDVKSLKYRIELMARLEFGDFNSAYVTNTSLLVQNYEKNGTGSFAENIATEIYRTTDLGKKVIQDYKTNSKKHKKELWLKNAWIPIIVSFVTTVLTNYLLPKLLHLIEWLTHIL